VSAAFARIHHGDIVLERIGGGQVQPAIGDACNDVEGIAGWLPAKLPGAGLLRDELGGVAQGVRMTDQHTKIDVHGRVDRRATDRKIAEVDGAELI